MIVDTSQPVHLPVRPFLSHEDEAIMTVNAFLLTKSMLTQFVCREIGIKWCGFRLKDDEGDFVQDEEAYGEMS